MTFLDFLSALIPLLEALKPGLIDIINLIARFITLLNHPDLLP